MRHQSSRLALSAGLAAFTLNLAPALADGPSFDLPSPPSYEGDGWSAKISGRVQHDYSTADADRAANFDVDASEWRRVRLAVSGGLGTSLKYKAELNTNNSDEINFEDVWIEYAPQGSAIKIKLGQFKTQNALDEQTSSRFISTLERAAFTDAFQFNRRVGVAISTKGDGYTLSGGVFGGNLDGGNADQGLAVAARGTLHRTLENGALVHLGTSFRYRDQGDQEGLARYRQRPYTHLAGRIVSTGRVASSDTFLGAEAAMIMGPFWTSAEYGITRANSTTADNDPDFSGGYLEFGAFLNGQKTYKGGKFNRPEIKTPITEGGLGALSAVIRYDMIDLSDGAFDGGQLGTVIVGLDWWPTSHTRVGINYFNADTALGSSTSGLEGNFAALVNANVSGETVNGITARLQFDF